VRVIFVMYAVYFLAILAYTHKVHVGGILWLKVRLTESNILIVRLIAIKNFNRGPALVKNANDWVMRWSTWVVEEIWHIEPPKKTWWDCVKDVLESLRLSQEDVQCSSKWRRGVKWQTADPGSTAKWTLKRMYVLLIFVINIHLMRKEYNLENGIYSEMTVQLCVHKIQLNSLPCTERKKAKHSSYSVNGQMSLLTGTVLAAVDRRVKSFSTMSRSCPLRHWSRRLMTADNVRQMK